MSRPKNPANEGRITLSVRLTPTEMSLLGEAATLRGLTPTALITVAAKERAAQIINTSLGHFKQVAKDVSERLFKGKHDPMSAEQFQRLLGATEFGGVEFLQMVLKDSLDRYRSPEPDLPNLIDPLDVETEMTGVMEYQDRTLSDNDQKDKRFTDQQLVELWHNKNPEAKHLNARYVRDIRRNFNQGTQGHGQRNAQGTIEGPAKTLSLPYDKDGRPYPYSDRWLNACKKARGE